MRKVYGRLSVQRAEDYVVPKVWPHPRERKHRDTGRKGSAVTTALSSAQRDGGAHPALLLYTFLTSQISPTRSFVTFVIGSMHEGKHSKALHWAHSPRHSAKSTGLRGREPGSESTLSHHLPQEEITPSLRLPPLRWASTFHLCPHTAGIWQDTPGPL